MLFFMDDKRLIWDEVESRIVSDMRIFSIRESMCRSPDNETRKFTIIDAADWAITIPVLEGKEGTRFVMVKQWRHGARELSVEFPGGVFETGEDPAQAAVRELREETGYQPNKIRKLGELSPNPAIMSNRVHFFLAEDLIDTGRQDLDDDEYVEPLIVDASEVIKNMGQAPYIHALMGTALSLYLQNVPQANSR